MTIRLRYWFRSLPSSDVYRELVSASLKFCDKFLLILRVIPVASTLDGKLQKFLNEIEEFKISDDLKREWPGTITMGDPVNVRIYNLNKVSAEILRNFSSGLEEWVASEFPEDLCFLRGDSTPWFTSITHEQTAFIEIFDYEQKKIEKFPLLLGQVQLNEPERQDEDEVE